MEKSHTIEQTLDSREVAEMIEKEHHKLLRDIRRYIQQLGESKIGFTDFFRESTYQTAQNKQLPCYRITKKGCEFIAHKLTGTKGTAFTARYINRFHEMQQFISDQAEVQEQKAEPERPWFIKKFQGGNIMLFRDFKEITGVEMDGNYTSLKRPGGLIGGQDWNAYGWKGDNEWFRKEYGFDFDFSVEPVMNYLYPCGILKAFQILEKENRNKPVLDTVLKTLEQAVSYTLKLESEEKQGEPKGKPASSAIQINITIDKNMFEIC